MGVTATLSHEMLYYLEGDHVDVLVKSGLFALLSAQFYAVPNAPQKLGERGCMDGTVMASCYENADTNVCLAASMTMGSGHRL